MTDTDRLAALLDVLREANNVIENNYGPDPSLVYDVKRWQKFQRAVNRANDLAAAGVTVGLDVERMARALETDTARRYVHEAWVDGGVSARYDAIIDRAARAYATPAQPAEEEGR